jgi:hypothetical protein
MDAMNRVCTTLMALFIVVVAILGFTEGMFWVGLGLFVAGAVLIFGAVSGRFWISPF